MHWVLYILDLRFVLFLCTTAVWQLQPYVTSGTQKRTRTQTESDDDFTSQSFNRFCQRRRRRKFENRRVSTTAVRPSACPSVCLSQTAGAGGNSCAAADSCRVIAETKNRRWRIYACVHAFSLAWNVMVVQRLPVEKITVAHKPSV